MTTLYPVQDTFVRGEISPRLHARASLDLYRAALSKCENFVTLPHGGIRKRGGTIFVGEVKNAAKTTRGIPFIFSSEQAYCLEFGDFYIRVYAYGARVGTVEIASPYADADLFDLAYCRRVPQMVADQGHAVAARCPSAASSACPAGFATGRSHTFGPGGRAGQVWRPARTLGRSRGPLGRRNPLLVSKGPLFVRKAKP
jgi:hypothetical protein